MIDSKFNQYETASKNGIVQYDKIKSKSNKSIFGTSSFLSFTSNQKPSDSNTPGIGSICLNALPGGNGLEKFSGYSTVGEHIERIDLLQYEGLLAGELGETGGEVKATVFKLIRKVGTQNTEFWVLDSSDNVWKLQNPFDDYWIETTERDKKGNTIFKRNDNPKSVYNFVGDSFSYCVFKGCLYICSGKESLVGSNGVGNLLKFDGYEWNSVLTGNAGFIKNQPEYFNASALDTATQEFKDKNFKLYDGTKPFNPSIVMVFKEKLFISGAISNPLQVKQSEWNNPDNFIDNVLGFQTAPLTSKDVARPSSFLVSGGINKINSMDVFNDSIYIGTDKGFYIYQLVNQNLQNGSFFQIDSIQENKFTPAGSVNQQSTIVAMNNLFFLSDYQIQPEFSSFELHIVGTSGKAYASYKKLSDEINNLFSNVDYANACIGTFLSMIMIGCNYNGQRITIVANPYSDGQDTKYGYFILDYITPSCFFNNRRGCYFTSTRDGNVYVITPNNHSIERKIATLGGTIVEETTTAVWQSLWDGYNPKTDNPNSQKTVSAMYIKGYFSKGTKVYITLIKNNKQDTQQIPNHRTFMYEFTEEDLISKDNSIIGLFDNLLYRYGARYHTKVFAFPQDKEIYYQNLAYRIDIVNSNYWYLEEVFFGTTQQGNTVDGDMLEIEEVS